MIIQAWIDLILYGAASIGLLEMFDGPRQREIQSVWRTARAK